MVGNTFARAVTATLLSTAASLDQKIPMVAMPYSRHDGQVSDTYVPSGVSGRHQSLELDAEPDIAQYSLGAEVATKARVLEKVAKDGVSIVVDRLKTAVSGDRRFGTGLSDVSAGRQREAAGSWPDFGQSLRRRLQTCSSGESFSITSSLFDFAEGCYEELEGEDYNGEVIYVSGSNIIILMAYSTSTSDMQDYLWALFDASDEEEPRLVCVDVQDPPPVHPTLGEWACDTTGDSDLEMMSAAKFSLTCGCSLITQAPAPQPTFTPVAEPTAPRASTLAPVPAPTPQLAPETCSSGESFSITSSLLDFAEGCYEELEGEDYNGEVIYVSGFYVIILAASSTSTSDMQDYLWALFDASDEEEPRLVCVDVQDPPPVHPTLGEWTCDTTGDSDFEMMSAAKFSLTCGCSLITQAPAPQPTFTPVAEPTAPRASTLAPVPAPTPQLAPEETREPSAAATPEATPSPSRTRIDSTTTPVSRDSGVVVTSTPADSSPEVDGLSSGSGSLSIWSWTGANVFFTVLLGNGVLGAVFATIG